MKMVPNKKLIKFSNLNHSRMRFPKPPPKKFHRIRDTETKEKPDLHTHHGTTHTKYKGCMTNECGSEQGRPNGF